MLSIDQCRQLLGAATPEDESDLLRIRDNMYELAQLFVQLLHCGEVPLPDSSLPPSDQPLERDTRSEIRAPFSVLCSVIGDEAADALVERAAIMEFDGELTRDDAERLALAGVEAWKIDPEKKF